MKSLIYLGLVYNKSATKAEAEVFVLQFSVLTIRFTLWFY